MTCQASGKTAEGFKLVPWLGLLQREDEAQRKVSMERFLSRRREPDPSYCGAALIWGRACPRGSRTEQVSDWAL